jgi:hypothetical protein
MLNTHIAGDLAERLVILVHLVPVHHLKTVFEVVLDHAGEKSQLVPGEIEGRQQFQGRIDESFPLREESQLPS